MFVNNVEWHHVDGSHTFNFNTDSAPLTNFDVEPAMRVDSSRDKLMAHGQWPTRSYRGGMSIHCEGDLFGDQQSTDLLTSTDYVTKRKSMVLALFGDPDAAIVDEYMGGLRFQPAGETEMWVAQFCTIEAFQAPIEALNPAHSKYLVTFHSFDPWFVGLSSGNKYMWS